MPGGLHCQETSGILHFFFVKNNSTHHYLEWMVLPDCRIGEIGRHGRLKIYWLMKSCRFESDIRYHSSIRPSYFSRVTLSQGDSTSTSFSDYHPGGLTYPLDFVCTGGTDRTSYFGDKIYPSLNGIYRTFASTETKLFYNNKYLIDLGSPHRQNWLSWYHWE